jgi:hypothetical protein
MNDIFTEGNPAGVINLNIWGTYEFPWGTAVKDERHDKWVTLFLKPNAQQIDVEHLNVILHDNGIEFV